MSDFLLCVLLLYGTATIAFLWYVSNLLLYLVNLVSKAEPLTHQSYLGSLAGKVLFRRPATYRVFVTSSFGVEECYQGMNEEKAIRTFLLHQEAPEVSKITVVRNGRQYKEWVRPTISVALVRSERHQ